MDKKKWWQMGGGVWGSHLLEFGDMLSALWSLIKKRKS